MLWRAGKFTVNLFEHGGEVRRPEEVRGIACPPWIVFRGSPFRPGGEHFTVLHTPTDTMIVTLEKQGDCKLFLAELMELRMAWHESDPPKVTGPDLDRARAIFQSYKQSDKRVPW